MKYLALLPFAGILIGVPLLNQVQPLIFGMPLILAWIVMWIVISTIIMGVIYLIDPANRSFANHPETDHSARNHSSSGPRA